MFWSTIEYGVSNSIRYGVSSFFVQYSVFTQQINTAYPLPLDTAYRSSRTETDILDFRAKFFLPSFGTNPTDCLSLVSGGDFVLDSRGAVPTKTTADAKKAIQDMAEYSQKWHKEISRGRSTETSDGLVAIQAQLNNLGREIKKVNEKVYAAQVGCEQCKGPHYTKDCPQKEEGKTLEEAYYTQFGRPFQGGGYRATAPGYYQRNNANPSFQEQRQSMEETLSKFMSESAKRHEENSNLIKEI
ncbi:DNA-directed DNA polymerase [Tanacetum coccineum]